MRWVTASAGKLHIDSRCEHVDELRSSPPWELGLPRGAIHELLFDRTKAPPIFAALMLANAEPQRSLIFLDPESALYPPALVTRGISIEQLIIIRPNRNDLIWTIAECLRCPAASAVIAPLPERMKQVEARRLQLAAEKGNALGLMIRPARADVYAAATRWLLTPMPGERLIQKWKAEFVHGHGWRTGQSFILERHRHARPNQNIQSNSMYSSSPLADRATPSSPGRASA